LSFFCFVAPTKANAFSLGELLTKVRDLFSPREEKGLGGITINSEISRVPTGDVNANGVIDSGDIVRFTYQVTNNTDQEYEFGELKTNVNRNMITFIHNIRAVSLNDKNESITFPN